MLKKTTTLVATLTAAMAIGASTASAATWQPVGGTYGQDPCRAEVYHFRLSDGRAIAYLRVGNTACRISARIYYTSGKASFYNDAAEGTSTGVVTKYPVGAGFLSPYTVVTVRIPFYGVSSVWGYLGF